MVLRALRRRPEHRHSVSEQEDAAAKGRELSPQSRPRRGGAVPSQGRRKHGEALARMARKEESAARQSSLPYGQPAGGEKALGGRIAHEGAGRGTADTYGASRAAGCL